jgi:hypothetical protein
MNAHGGIGSWTVTDSPRSRSSKLAVGQTLSKKRKGKKDVQRAIMFHERLSLSTREQQYDPTSII